MVPSWQCHMRCRLRDDFSIKNHAGPGMLACIATTVSNLLVTEETTSADVVHEFALGMGKHANCCCMMQLRSHLIPYTVAVRHAYIPSWHGQNVQSL
jgi:hypothetical protein